MGLCVPAVGEIDHANRWYAGLGSHILAASVGRTAGETESEVYTPLTVDTSGLHALLGRQFRLRRRRPAAPQR